MQIEDCAAPPPAKTLIVIVRMSTPSQGEWRLALARGTILPCFDKAFVFGERWFGNCVR
jgi:hypothetical protein